MITGRDLANQHMADTYRQLKDEAVSYVDAAIPAPPFAFSNETDPAYLPGIRTTWGAAQAALANIDQLLGDMANELAIEAASNGDYTPAAQQTRRAAIISNYTAKLTEQRTAATASLNRIITAITTAALPQRPQPEDVLQEAKLAGLKDDVRMLLGNCDTGETGDKLASYLSSALDNGDALAAWLIAGSGWVAMYLQGRFDGHDLTIAQGDVDVRIANALDQRSGTDEMAVARTLYRKLTDGQRGCVCLLTITSGFLTNLITNLTEW